MRKHSINALKYRKQGVSPVVRIAAEWKQDFWMFSVADNGISFDPAYSERIFGIFKRLHHRHEYPGNGIGLSICGESSPSTAEGSGPTPRLAGAPLSFLRFRQPENRIELTKSVSG